MTLFLYRNTKNENILQNEEENKKKIGNIQDHNEYLLVVLSDNFQYTNIGTGKETNDTEHDQQNVLDQNPIESAKARPLIERNDFD